jgi:hypothetical protein
MTICNFFLPLQEIGRYFISLIHPKMEISRNKIAVINELCTSGKKTTTQQIDNENGILNLE